MMPTRAPQPKNLAGQSLAADAHDLCLCADSSEKAWQPRGLIVMMLASVGLGQQASGTMVMSGLL